MRIKAATLAAVIVATCAACGWTTTGAAGLTSRADTAFTEIPGFTVTEICPADVDPAFAGQEFDGLTAGIVSQNGDKILRVLAGQPKSRDGQALVDSYLDGLSTKTHDGVGLASFTAQLGRHAVTHFNIPLTAEGYAYAGRRTVLIAYVESGSPPATVEDALTKMLDDL